MEWRQGITLPIACGLLELEAHNIKEIRARMKYGKDKLKYYHDRRGTKELPQPDQSVTRESLARKTPLSPEVTATRGSTLYTTWSGGQVKKSVKLDLQLIFMELDRRWTRSNDRRCQLYQHFLFPFSSYIFFFVVVVFLVWGFFFCRCWWYYQEREGRRMLCMPLTTCRYSINKTRVLL